MLFPQNGKSHEHAIVNIVNLSVPRLQSGSKIIGILVFLKFCLPGASKDWLPFEICYLANFVYDYDKEISSLPLCKNQIPQPYLNVVLNIGVSASIDGMYMY